jgi:type III secretion system (T3SS) SseB-like protein
VSLPYARGYDEIYLYMGLRPCVCGETEFDDRVSTTLTVDDRPAERFSGHCSGCRRFRQFTFAMPEELPELSFDIRYGGDEPSRLLDPGEWLGVAEMYTSSTEQGTPPGGLIDDDEITRAYYLLTSAVAALDEVLKFIPDGADAVPEGAFWSQAGHKMYEMMPDRFGRAGLERERERAQARVAEFEETYSSDGDDESADDGPRTTPDPATGWAPANRSEVTMANALADGDQRTYFRHVLTIPLFLPVPRAGWPTGTVPGWPPEECLTWSGEGRTFLLVFSSPAGLESVTGPEWMAGPPVSFHDVVAAVPDPTWWFAINPGLPIEAYLPPELVAPVAEGTVVLPVMPEDKERDAPDG